MTSPSRRIPKWIRILLPSFIIVVWFVLGGIGGPYFGKISQVATNDQASFLPASAESTKVTNELAAFQDRKSIPAIIVFGGDASLTPATLAKIQLATKEIAALPGNVGAVSPPIPSRDGNAALVVANASSNVDYKTYVSDIKQILDKASVGAPYKITGPIGFLNDLSKAFAGIDGILLGVALAVVFIILLIVYRSPVLPFLVLLNSMFALAAAILVVFYLAQAGIVTINGQVQGILFILVIGAATDYSLLFISRYREELAHHEKPYQALLASWRRSVEPIVAAGGTVIAGLLCLLLSDLNSNKALGPVGAIGIALAIMSALSLLPSLLLPWGRKAFWPRSPKFSAEKASDAALSPQKRADKLIQSSGLWPRTARFVQRHSRAIWIVTTGGLIVLALGITQLQASGVPQSQLILGSSEARDGQAIIDAHFPGGSGTPLYAIASQDKAESILSHIKASDGVASANFQTESSDPAARYTGAGKPKVVDGKVVIEATLTNTADSEAAQQTVSDLRSSLRRIDSSVLIGGTSATQLDTQLAAQHDQAIVIPTVLVVITIILMLLLRSILAPLLLLLTTILSFAATLGVSALIFNHVFHFPGADPSIILYGFIFLVALGIDYNIFLMTRVREESRRATTRKGVLVGLIVTGGVITSAGIVLAATFAALAVIPILFLAQLAFIVAFGVLLDTIVVRSLLVPALVHAIGSPVWWPVRKIK